MKRKFVYDVGKDYNGKNIKMLLKQYYKMSSSLISALKRCDDGIIVNGERRYVTYILKENDIVEITITEGASEGIVPLKMDIDIIYEDEDIIIVNKPPYLPTHPSMGHYENTLANGLMYYFRNEERTFRAVNRLDKDTSGLMAVAKNGYIHARLCDELRAKNIKRKYTAIVCGDLKTDGVIDAPIGRESESVIKRCVCNEGQRAVTHYRVIKRYGDYTLIDLELETGRTHQIRVHMSHIGYPLLGDWLYGEENHNIFDRQALHSSYISLIHPVKNIKIEHTIELAEDMKRFLSSLK